MADSSYIRAATAADFDRLVLEESHRVPVLVDFWAAWCGPCQSLMPVLQRLAEDYAGAFLLVKVDTEAEQELAARHGIRSLPTLRLYRNGEVVEEVMGAQPEPVLREMLDRHVTREWDRLRAAARASAEAGDTDRALELLAEAAAMAPADAAVAADRARLLAERGEIEEARALLEGLPCDKRESPEVKAVLGSLRLAAEAAVAAPEEELRQRLEADADDSEARYLLGVRLAARGDYEPALEQFLELMRRDRTWGDDAGRKALLTVFEVLGNEGELVARYRKAMFNLLH